MERPLHCWTDSHARDAIVEFVARVTAKGGADYVPPAARIATFDNDGTLWCEQPMQAQVFFLADRVKDLAGRHPSIKDRQPFKAFIEHDFAKLHELGKRGIEELFFSTHAGMTEDEFDVIARAWLASAKHPKLARRFPDLAYQPQIALLDYLHAAGFRCFIVSGGGVDLIRAFSEDAYGVPRERVIGSSAKLHCEEREGRIVVMKQPELDTFDDRETKVENIARHIGRRPILAFGNSDGDLAMLRYTLTGTGPRLGLLLHHDDAAREYAYDRDFKLSPLTEALDKAGLYGITVVSMKNHWSAVFD